MHRRPPLRSPCRFFLLAALAVMVAGMAACSHSPVDGAAFRVQVDTVAGIVHLRHLGSPTVSRLEPLATIGEEGAAEELGAPDEFGRIVSVAADSSGNIYLADGVALELRVFAPDGRFLRRMGRKGEGPGEFRGLHGITWIAGDTLLVMDYGNARLSFTRSNGEAVGQWPWMTLTGDRPFLFGAGPGEAYAQTRRTADGGGGIQWVWARYTATGPTDTLAIPMAEQRSMMAICRGDETAGIGFFSNPFGDRLITLPAPFRERVVAWASGYRIAFLDAAGDTVRVISRELAPTPLSDSAWAPVADEYAEFRKSWQGVECEGGIERPAAHPVLESVTFDHAGRLLVEYLTSAGPMFDLYAPDGESFQMFSSSRTRDHQVPPFLRGDRLYLVTRDNQDVQQLRSYRILPGDQRR